MGLIQADTSKMTEYKEYIKEELKNMEDELLDMQKKLDKLNESWVGDSYDSFKTRFNEEFGMFLHLVRTLGSEEEKSLVSYENQAILEYDKCKQV